MLLPQPLLYTEVQQSELLLRGLPWKANPPEVALFLLGCGFQVNEGDIQLCLYQGRSNGRDHRGRHQGAVRSPRPDLGQTIH